HRAISRGGCRVRLCPVADGDDDFVGVPVCGTWTGISVRVAGLGTALAQSVAQAWRLDGALQGGDGIPDVGGGGVAVQPGHGVLRRPVLVAGLVPGNGCAGRLDLRRISATPSCPSGADYNCDGSSFVFWL